MNVSQSPFVCEGWHFTHMENTGITASFD